MRRSDGIRRSRILTVGLAVVALFVGTPALAHPHIIADVTVEFVYNSNGNLAALREVWRYDAFYSAFVRRVADTDRDGRLSPSEIKSFGDEQIKALDKFGYYTNLSSVDDPIALGPAEAHDFVEMADSKFELSFTLPLRSTIQSASYRVKIFDPQFFAYFTVNRSNGVVLRGAKTACETDIQTPQPINLKQTASIPAALWKALDGSASDGLEFVNRISVSCL